MSGPRECQQFRFEDLFGGTSGALFSFAMGLSAVAIPLYALRSGFSDGQVGVLVALSACAQLGSRSVIGSLMRRVADKYFVVGAALLMSLSCLALVTSTSLVAFVLSQLAQGAARGFFWTGSQTHAVRTSPSSVAALARINLLSGIGQILGPFLAGPLIDHLSTWWALVCGAGFGAAAMLPAMLLARLEPLRPKAKRKGSMAAAWQQPGVGLASWAGATAGGWRAMMNSYVPVVLSAAGQGASAVGVVAGIANAASIAGTGVAGRISVARLRPYLVAGISTTGVGIALFGVFAGQVAVGAAALAVSGLAAGLLQTAGPALASEVVGPDERGEALATAGTYRAAALLLAPLGVAGLLGVMAASSAVAVLGVAIAGPVVLARGFGRAGTSIEE